MSSANKRMSLLHLARLLYVPAPQHQLVMV